MPRKVRQHSHCLNLKLLIFRFKNEVLNDLEYLQSESLIEHVSFLIWGIEEKKICCAADCIKYELFTLCQLFPLKRRNHLFHVFFDEVLPTFIEHPYHILLIRADVCDKPYQLNEGVLYLCTLLLVLL